jgi:periplasmic divalent cation tolerance protein
MEKQDIVLILTTFPDDDRAEALARTLVEERLAACVNVLSPMASFYRWKGAIERDVERQVVIKTTRGLVTAVQSRVRELHKYELPEFLVLSADGGSDAYIGWIREQVTGPSSG